MSITDAAKRKVLKGYGISSDATKDELIWKLIRLTDSVKKNQQNDKQLTSKQFIQLALDKFYFPKKQARLLNILSTCKPIDRLKIIKFVGITSRKNRRFDALKSLVSATRATIKRHHRGDKVLTITHLEGRLTGYRLAIHSHLVKHATA